MSLSEVAELGQYHAYRAGFRHAPRSLRRLEQLAHVAASRQLATRRLTVGLEDGTVTLELIGWDAAYASDLARYAQRAVSASVQFDARPGPRAADVTPRGLARSATADLVLVELPAWRAAVFARNGWLVLPKRVAHRDDLSRAEPRVASAARRALRDSGLGFFVTRHEADLARFVRELYLPMVAGQHGEHGRPTSLPLLRSVHRSGWLVVVNDGARWHSGALVAPHPTEQGTLSVVVIGQPARSSTSDAAGFAPVACARDFAVARGASALDHLVTRPFLRDGLFLRKRRWDTRVVDLPERPDRVALWVARDTAAVRRWLRAWPLIACDGAGLVRVAWSDPSREAEACVEVPGLERGFVLGSDPAQLRQLAMELAAGLDTERARREASVRSR